MCGGVLLGALYCFTIKKTIRNKLISWTAMGNFHPDKHNIYETFAFIPKK